LWLANIFIIESYTKYKKRKAAKEIETIKTKWSSTQNYGCFSAKPENCGEESLWLKFSYLRNVWLFFG